MTSRRDFIKHSSLLAAGTLIGMNSTAKNLKRSEEMIIGHGKYKYKLQPGWGVLDAGVNPVNNCHELVEDHLGRLILLTDEVKNNVLIYDKSGKLLQSWGTTYPGAHGLTIAGEKSDQFLLITDTTRNQVIKTDLKGKELMKMEYPKDIPSYLAPYQFKPTETAVNSDNGDIYVTDGYGQNFIIQYNERGKYIRHFGGLGESLETNFDCCHGIAIDNRIPKQPRLMVTDRKRNALKYFTLKGEYLSTINLPGSYVCRPRIIGDHIYAAVFRSTSNTNARSGYIQILDKDNKVVSTPGGTEPVYVNNVLQPQSKDANVPALIHPHDVYVDSDENIYIAQWASDKTYPLKLVRV